MTYVDAYELIVGIVFVLEFLLRVESAMYGRTERQSFVM